MKLDRAQSISDLRLLAKKRLPKILFELIESGVEDETSLIRNRAAFARYTFLPRYLGDITVRDQSSTLFGHTYRSPFGIAPTGFAGLMRRGIDEALATGAAAAGIPFILSGASVASIEAIAKLAPETTWAHIYPAKDGAITERTIDRNAAAGVETLVLTVDNPVFPKRERDNRNGFTLPLRLPLPIIVEALRHPAWLREYLAGGMPMMQSWHDYAPEGATAAQVAAFFRSQSPSIQDWRSIARMRERWRGRFVLKGIQHPDDATRAIDAGVDGIVVSNHGGKSFDSLPSPLATLPGIRLAVRHRIPVMMDSGIRRGSEILIAKALGADFVFVGRATLYGAVAGGRVGVDRAIAILKQEIDMSLAMIGAQCVAALDSSWLLPDGASR
jgi:isopentenyl diphosphate isomerase/L-lactate dehydrogenase-like FMN-dependent dehydrogenase